MQFSEQSIQKGIEELMRRAGDTEYDKGFRENLPFEAEGIYEGSVEYYRLRASYVAAKLALVNSEVSEALEEIRKPPVNGDQDLSAFGEELADIVIRVAALADLLCIDLGIVTYARIEKSAKRPYRHGGKLI